MSHPVCRDCRWAKIVWHKGDAYTWTSSYPPYEESESTRPTDSLQCRRHAPTKAVFESSYDGWPYLDDLDDWCGEWTAKEEPKP